MLDWIIEGIRLIIWALASACLTLMDICYDIVVDLAKADFLRDSSVWQWYSILMLFLGSLVLIRACSVYFKLAFDEEFAEKVSGFNFIQSLVKIALVVAFLPSILGFVGQVSSWGVENLNIVVGTASAEKPSTLIITSFMNTKNGEYDTKGNWVAGEKVTYTLEDVDINEDGVDDADFKFFDSMTDLFLIAFIGIASAILLIINGVQIGGRMYSIVIKLLVAPLPLSSLIVPGDETFTMWRKMILSDYLLNYLQTLMLTVVMILSGSKILSDMGVWVQIISLISGFFMLLKGIPELSKLVGGDTSQGGMLQQIASFRQASSGIAHAGASAVMGGVSAAIGGAKAIGTGAGFMSDKMGSSFMADIKKGKPKSEDGFMGGNKANDGKQKYSESGFDKGNSFGGQGGQGGPEGADTKDGYQGNGSQHDGEELSSHGAGDFSQQGTPNSQGGGYESSQSDSPTQSSGFRHNTSNQSFAPTQGSKHMYQQKMSQLKATQQVRHQSHNQNTHRNKQGGNKR